ncbi:MAG: DUF2974 domain-containing protein [Eubacteriales bacterium]|nr:DUF2974 domain-containing protein [Eubacteriales bacterium]
MGNLYDYVSWRGDLSILQDGFHHIDNLALCNFSYVNVDKVFEEARSNVLTIREISDLFFQIYTEEDLNRDKSLIKNAPYFMREMAKTERFGNLIVKNYVNHIDTTINIQFSAMEIILPDETSFVAFRGTDDTIVGWKEDFYMVNSVVSAQKEAVNFLNEILDRSKRKIRIGGHSKGGNLAVYAAACCNSDIQNRILTVYNNDGPGFFQDFFETEGYKRIENRIVRIIPEDSIIGMLLYHSTKPVIISSQAINIMQHDLLTWEMIGPELQQIEDLSRTAYVADQAVKEWLESIEEEDREEIICDLFAVLEATEVETFTEIYEGGIKSLQKMMKRVGALSPKTREKISLLLMTYINCWEGVVKEKVHGWKKYLI